MSVLIRNARVLMGATKPPLARGDVFIQNGKIAGVAPGGILGPAESVIEADGRVLMPAFVDAHTHAMWAGDRLDEFGLKQRGASYLEILKAGGGILSTVRAVRAASQDELMENLLCRLALMLREGTTTVEVKSGYGLTTADELKML